LLQKRRPKRRTAEAPVLEQNFRDVERLAVRHSGSSQLAPGRRNSWSNRKLNWDIVNVMVRNVKACLIVEFAGHRERTVSERGMPMTPELVVGIGILVLLAALIYGAIKAGHLTARQRWRTDAATEEMQRRVPESRPVA